MEASPDGLNLTVTSKLHPQFELPSRAAVESGRIMFHPANNPFSALEQYASTYAKAGQVKLNPIINGWNSWFYTYRDISEDEVVRNAEFVAKHLKRYGMNVVQIDDGFYRMFGDWEGNERFPHGMKWLADRIRSLDLVAGLWLGPYVIDKRTEVAQKHPEYLVHGLDGELHPIGHGGENYALDITHPGGASGCATCSIRSRTSGDTTSSRSISWNGLCWRRPAITTRPSAARRRTAWDSKPCVRPLDQNATCSIAGRRRTR